MENKTFTRDEINSYMMILGEIEHCTQKKHQLNLKLGINKSIDLVRNSCKEEVLNDVKPLFIEQLDIVKDFFDLLNYDDNETYNKIVSKKQHLSEEDREIFIAGDMEKIKNINLEQISPNEDENAAIFNKGIEYFNNNDFSKALIYISFLCLTHPKSTKIWMLKGMIQQNLENYQKALESYSYSIFLDPTNLESYVNLMNCLILDKKTNEAQTIYEELLRTMEKTGINNAEFDEKLDVIHKLLKT